jgi:hypothetical protein
MGAQHPPQRVGKTCSNGTTVKPTHVLFATAALFSTASLQATERRNEIWMSAATGLGASDPNGFAAVFYQRSFQQGAFVGGGVGSGHVLKDRKTLRLSARAGYRFAVSGWGDALWPQASLEVATPWPMGNDAGTGAYLNLGLAGALEKRFLYGLELQTGRVRHSTIGAPSATGTVKNVRASLAIRF